MVAVSAPSLSGCRVMLKPLVAHDAKHSMRSVAAEGYMMAIDVNDEVVRTPQSHNHHVLGIS